jgi:glycosyltransferase involved in cell wall biosynthesis
VITSLSAYIIVKNEARDIPGCLDSLKGLADQVVVVDDESTDPTVALCKNWGARVFSRKLEGFGSQKQFALEQCTGDWVLSVDADERVTPELAREIKAVIAQNSPVAGYLISRNMYFLGHRLRHGGVGKDWVLRFFRRDKGRYLPKEIHEQVIVSGTTQKLRSPLDHFSYATLEEYLEKLPAYTALSARKKWEAGQRFSIVQHFRPAWELFIRVVIKGAWLDGQAGLIYAALSSHAAWLRYVKLWELEQSDDR